MLRPRAVVLLLLRHHLLDNAGVFVAGRRRCLVDIAYVEDTLRREQVQRPERWLVLLVDPREPRRLSLAQEVERHLHRLERFDRFLVAALCPLLDRRDPPLEALEIGEHQLRLDGLDVGQRIDVALDMHDIGILEAAHDMRDRLDLADVGEELVAEAFALGGAAHEARDVHKGQSRRNDLGRFAELRERGQPRVRYGDLAGVRLDGAERIVGGLRGGRPRQCVEERRLAHVRQADDAAAKTHGSLSWDGQRAERISVREKSSPL